MFHMKYCLAIHAGVYVCLKVASKKSVHEETLILKICICANVYTTWM